MKNFSQFFKVYEATVIQSDENVATIIDENINPFDYTIEHDSGDMHVSSYGFDGYDDDYAREVFESELDI